MTDHFKLNITDEKTPWLCDRAGELVNEDPPKRSLLKVQSLTKAMMWTSSFARFLKLISVTAVC